MCSIVLVTGKAVSPIKHLCSHSFKLFVHEGGLGVHPKLAPDLLPGLASNSVCLLLLIPRTVLGL